MSRCQHGFLPPLCGNCHPRVAADPKARRGDPSRFHHPGFVDMTGQLIAGCVVIKRAPNVQGNARWFVRAACGHHMTVQGIRLRAEEKAGREMRCKDCGHLGRRAP